MTKLFILLNQTQEKIDIAEFVDALAYTLSHLIFFIFYLAIFCLAVYCLRLICNYFIEKNKRDETRTAQQIIQERCELIEFEKEKDRKIQKEGETIKTFIWFFTGLTLFFAISVNLFRVFYLEKDFSLSLEFFLVIGLMICNYILLNIQKIEEKITDSQIFVILSIFLTVEALIIFIKQDILFHVRLFAGIITIIYGVAILYCYFKNNRINKKALQ